MCSSAYANGIVRPVLLLSSPKETILSKALPLFRVPMSPASTHILLKFKWEAAAERQTGRRQTEKLKFKFNTSFCVSFHVYPVFPCPYDL